MKNIRLNTLGIKITALYKGTILLALIFSFSFAIAQKNNWDSLTQKFIANRNKTLQEKIFVHIDRTFYVAGESMWFKLYCVDGYFHQPLDVSKVAYLEILDKNNKAVIQTKLSLLYGEGNGQVQLPISLNSGNYLVRVYTAWMKNFSPEFYFQQPITIVNTVRKTESTSNNNSSKYDLQFFPEGGYLVDGIKSTIAFCIVDQTGKGQDVSGIVLNQKGDTVTTFKTLKFGIGSFTLRPSITEKYKVFIKEKSINISSIEFPKVEVTGYVLHVNDTISNQLAVTVHAKENISLDETIYLFVHTRQSIKITQVIPLQNGRTTIILDKNKLGEGISHITLFNKSGQPLCERLYFKQPAEKLNIKVLSTEEKFKSRKKIKLEVQVSNASFKSGSFSMSVFKTDSLKQLPAIDIQHYEFLTSDLKGTVENPAFYFSNDPLVTKATENLMLTHGWSRFNWKDLFNTDATSILFNPEYRGPIITGKIQNAKTGLGVAGIQTFLSTPSKNVRLYGSLSDANGNLTFEMRDFYDKKKIYVQPRINQDSAYQIEIKDPFSESFSTLIISPLNYTSNWKDPLTLRSISMQTEDTYHSSKSIFVNNPSFDSTTFYGKADETYLLDDYTRFSVMEEVMREYVHGVWVRKKDGKFIFKVPNEPRHSLFENESLVTLDGVPIFDIDKLMTLSPLKVQKLDVMTRKYFLGPFAFEGVVSYITYKGDLGGFELDPKVAVLDYQGLQVQKEFFSPKYETNSEIESRLADRRNLLYWSPNIKLQGHKINYVEFYSSDENGIYNVIIQGISSTGVTGTNSSFLEVVRP